MTWKLEASAAKISSQAERLHVKWNEKKALKFLVDLQSHGRRVTSHGWATMRSRVQRLGRVCVHMVGAAVSVLDGTSAWAPVVCVDGVVAQGRA